MDGFRIWLTWTPTTQIPRAMTARATRRGNRWLGCGFSGICRRTAMDGPEARYSTRPQVKPLLKCLLSVEDAGTKLKVRGFIGLSMLGRCSIGFANSPAQKTEGPPTQIAALRSHQLFVAVALAGRAPTSCSPVMGATGASTPFSLVRRFQRMRNVATAGTETRAPTTPAISPPASTARICNFRGEISRDSPMMRC